MQEHEDNLVAVIRQARVLIQRGWCQGWYAKTRTVRGGVVTWEQVNLDDLAATHFCLVGALSRAAAELNLSFLEPWVYDHVLKSLPRGYGNLVRYNDRPGRRQETILKRLDIAAGGK